jgi:hypothetical protein
MVELYSPRSVSEDTPNYLATHLATSLAGSGMDDRNSVPSWELTQISVEQISGVAGVAEVVAVSRG